MSYRINFRTVHTYTIGNIGFDNLSTDTVNKIFKDGRPFAHFIEHWLEKNYSELTHVSGCKNHDFINTTDNSIKYDEKTFTKRGCKYLPSSMIGTGRTFNREVFESHANELNYIIVSNVHFPTIKVSFITGSDLLIKYPNGKIPFHEHDSFFG